MARKRASIPVTDTAEQDFPESVEISKSQLKREALSKRSLAAELIALNAKNFANAPLDESLREEVRAARKITAHVAGKRQLMFVGKQLRNRDTSEIELFLENLGKESKQQTAKLHKVEAWRDFMLEQGDEALAEFMLSRPDADRQAMRQLIRNAQNELAKGKPPAAARSLFRMLRELDSSNPLPQPAE